MGRLPPLVRTHIDGSQAVFQSAFFVSAVAGCCWLLLAAACAAVATPTTGQGTAGRDSICILSDMCSGLDEVKC